jgi:sulfocyanin
MRGNNALRPTYRLAASVFAIALVVAACAPTRGQAITARTVEFELVAGKTPTNGTFNFNGYARGAMTLSVPAGWRVVIHYKNNSALRHSLSVVAYTGTQPEKAEPPVFAGASTRDLVDGIGVGREETITFVAGKAGKYEFFCGVLGHAQAGMWDFLVVSPTAKAPSVRPAAAAALKVK